MADDRARAPGISRRRLLALGSFAAGAGALVIPAAASGTAHRPAVRSTPRLAPPTVSAVDATEPPARLRLAPTTPPTPARTPPRPLHTVHTFDQPIRRLDDVIANVAGAHLPSNAIMLTIDDGPHPYWTPRYLRLLARYDITATFCVIGSQVAQHPELVRAAASEGHDIANHTFGHPLGLPRLSAARIRDEMADTTDAIVRATGYRPHQFRAPGGVWGPGVFAEAARQQMAPLGWDVDPRDWSLPGTAHIRAALLAARPHDIMLCHDGGGDRSQTFAALEDVIPALLARGWRFVTLRGVRLV